MPRIGLIVEPEFLEVHRGVRVYVYSLGRILARHGWRVDFVVPQLTGSGNWRWYGHHLREADLFAGVAPSSSGTPLEVWADLRKAAFERRRDPHRPETRALAGLSRPEVMPIGETLAHEEYDVLLVTNPWMVKWHDRLPARRVFGLVLDLIPNLFGFLLDEHKPFAFANQHAAGFRYYEAHCDVVLAISEATRRDYLDLVRLRAAPAGTPPVVVMPPMAPYYTTAGDRDWPAGARERARQVVLAGCFDARKGLADLPTLLNGIADHLDSVVIYGGPRCREAEVEAFFKALRVPHVTWHLGPRATHVRDVFRASRLLLFPSRFEGLGLPLIEAQLQGCRVATYPVSPMSELSLTGSVPLAATVEESVLRLAAAIAEPFDHGALRQEALAAFVEPTKAADPLAAAMAAS